jgi:hypothetical protein
VTCADPNALDGQLAVLLTIHEVQKAYEHRCCARMQRTCPSAQAHRHGRGKAAGGPPVKAASGARKGHKHRLHRLTLATRNGLPTTAASRRRARFIVCVTAQRATAQRTKAGEVAVSLNLFLDGIFSHRTVFPAFLPQFRSLHHRRRGPSALPPALSLHRTVSYMTVAS